ncbi:hypothetical protein LTS18_006246, partial [Coniosporium uncinatum]
IKRSALFYQLGSCGTVDGAVDTAASEEGIVCGVDDSGDAELGYIMADESDFGVVRRGGWVSRSSLRTELAELVEEREAWDITESKRRGHRGSGKAVKKAAHPISLL